MIDEIIVDGNHNEEKEKYINYAENKNYSNLTDAENAVLKDINLIMKTVVVDNYKNIQKKIVAFIAELQAEKGYDTKDYILGHRMIWSTPSDSNIMFDTPDHDIEKFIKSLKEKNERK